jgi:serine/threonine protein kinase
VPLTAGTIRGSYEILAPLGAGGMGEVYRARDLRLKRQVAVKALPERLAGDPQAPARFEREARALAALSHPNLLADRHRASVLSFDARGEWSMIARTWHGRVPAAKADALPEG